MQAQPLKACCWERRGTALNSACFIPVCFGILVVGHQLGLGCLDRREGLKAIHWPLIKGRCFKVFSSSAMSSCDTQETCCFRAGEGNVMVIRLPGNKISADLTSIFFSHLLHCFFFFCCCFVLFLGCLPQVPGIFKAAQLLFLNIACDCKS